MYTEITIISIMLLFVSVYFKVVLDAGSKEVISELVNVLLERVQCLYNDPVFQEYVRK